MFSCSLKHSRVKVRREHCTNRILSGFAAHTLCSWLGFVKSASAILQSKNRDSLLLSLSFFLPNCLSLYLPVSPSSCTCLCPSLSLTLPVFSSLPICLFLPVCLFLFLRLSHTFLSFSVPLLLSLFVFFRLSVSVFLHISLSHTFLSSSVLLLLSLFVSLLVYVSLVACLTLNQPLALPYLSSIPLPDFLSTCLSLSVPLSHRHFHSVYRSSALALSIFVYVFLSLFLNHDYLICIWRGCVLFLNGLINK